MSYQLTILIGHLSGDIKTLQSEQGTDFMVAKLATHERWTKGSESHTEWHSVIFFGALAKTVKALAGKGSKLMVQGRIRTHKWSDKKGQARLEKMIIADEVQFLSFKEQSKQYQQAKQAIAKVLQE